MQISSIVQLFEKLVSIPSPAGYTKLVVPHLEEYLRTLGFSPIRTRKGGVLLSIEGKSKTYQRMISAHIDTIGAMVKEIKSNGTLKIIKVGGFSWNAVEGEYCQIITRSGQIVTGTFLPVYASAHLSPEYENLPRNEEMMEIRLDIPVKTDEDVQRFGIGVGDFVAFDHRMVYTEEGFIKSRYLDNKINVALLLEVLREIKLNNIQLPSTTNIYINTHEEIGYGGNSNITPEIDEYLALDIGIVGHGQCSDEFSVSFCAMDSSGPYDHTFINFFRDLAIAHSIPYHIDIYPYYKSDASAALASGHDLIRGLIGPGVDASHSLERTHESSILFTAQLLYHYLTTDSSGYFKNT